MSIRRLLHSDAPPAPPLRFILLSSLGALIAIAITGGLNGNEKVVLRAGGFLNPGEVVTPRRDGE